MKQSLTKKLLPQKHRHKQKRMIKIYYSESKPDSNFAINSLSTSDSKFYSDDSQSDFNSVFINLDVCFFWP